MYKVNNKAMAEKLAKEHSLAYGMCVLDGAWYVGTTNQLMAIGVIIEASMELA